MAELFRPGHVVPAAVDGLGGPLVLAAHVVELYQWHDGAVGRGAAPTLFGLGWLFPPFEAQLESLRGLHDELEYWPEMPYWRPSWFPVLHAGLEAVSVDCESGAVWSSSISTGESSFVAPSLEVLFSRVISAYESGVFVVRDGRVGLADEDLDDIAFLSAANR